MRQIKFRVWSFLDKKFIPCYDMDTDGKWIHVAEGDQLFYVNDDNKQEFELQQFTGLKDKNSKEIYEGDIIRDAQGWEYNVMWLDTTASFELSPVKDYPVSHLSYHTTFHFRDMLKCEIIGNIFETPELVS